MGGDSLRAFGRRHSKDNMAAAHFFWSIPSWILRNGFGFLKSLNWRGVAGSEEADVENLGGDIPVYIEASLLLVFWSNWCFMRKKVMPYKKV